MHSAWLARRFFLGMKEFIDLRDLLKGWPYDPDDNVRKLRAKDGREVLQVRLPLGLEQHELDGRPDGAQPHGQESLLDYHWERLEQAKAAGKEDEFGLSHEECDELFAEGTLYYFRYLHCFQVKEWQRTLRDTSRNLRLFDFVHQRAGLEEDQLYLEQWRPYILRMQAAAQAMLELERGEHAGALAHLAAAARRIEALPELDDETFQYERQRSLAALREMAGQIEKVKPVSELESLERQLREAIEAQAFERAAALRDRIRALKRKC
jgi:hypothetical protein